MSEKLKSCPFCGGEAFVWHKGRILWIGCSKCPVSTHTVWEERKEEMIRAWNTRTKESEK